MKNVVFIESLFVKESKIEEREISVLQKLLQSPICHRGCVEIVLELFPPDKTNKSNVYLIINCHDFFF